MANWKKIGIGNLVLISRISDKACQWFSRPLDKANQFLTNSDALKPFWVLVPIVLFSTLLCITSGHALAACECNGGGTCYNVTDDISFDAVPWQALSPGDTVRIQYRTTPYQGNITVNDSGTEENPITICGVPDVEGNRPTIQGATTSPVILLDYVVSHFQIRGLCIAGGRRGVQINSYNGNPSVNIVIADNIIENNGDTASNGDNHGGGIEAHGDNILFNNNLIQNNYAGNGGGAWISGNNNRIENNTIENNTGYYDHGGGLYVIGSATISGNIIQGNRIGDFDNIPRSWGGGVLVVESPATTLSGNIYRNNYAKTKGGAIMIDEGSTATIQHELIYNNTSGEYGAAIAVDERWNTEDYPLEARSFAHISNCTVANNSSPGEANGVSVDRSVANVTDSIFWGNGGDDFGIRGDRYPGEINVAYSLANELWPGDGNLQTDPLFVDAANGNFHLINSTAGCSPAIDAGDPASDYADELENNGDRINMGVYGNTVDASNACGCSGSGTCYEVLDEATFDAVPWLDLGPGDTVRIHHRSEPYRKRFGLHALGTVDQPVRITGVKGPNGELPHLFGEDATTPANLSGFYNYGGTGYPGFRGMIIINAMQWGEIPANIIIENLKITGANENNQFYDENGVQRAYYSGAGGIYVYVVNGLTVRGCEIADNGNGFYTRSTGAEETTTRDILVERNYIHGNGNVDGDQRHNIYTESAGIIFQFNRIGRERPGARGSSFKDRSSGLVFRYNWIESTARTMDMVEAEDGAPILIYEPDYDRTYVYGNIIINEVDENDDYVSATNLIHYGGDNNVDDSTGQCTQFINGDPVCRTGTLYFYNNTVIVKDYRDTPAGSDWIQTRIFEISVNDVTADIRDNIFHLYAPNGDPNLALMDTWGTANLNGTNWMTSGWAQGHYNYWPGAGAAINDNGTLIQGTDPGFTSLGAISGNLSIDDYTPLETSTLVDRSGPLAAEAINAGHTLAHMYRLHHSGVPRVMTGDAMDLGAFESVTGSTVPTVFTADFAADETSVSEGQSVHFTDQSTGNPTSWSWNFGDGSAGSTEQHPQHAYQSAGTYTVSLTVANNDGSDTETKNNYITVSQSGSDDDPGIDDGIIEAETSVSAGNDDAEEDINGDIYLNSSDLELVEDGTVQTVGIRFAAVEVPQEATITSAYIQLTADEAQSVSTSLVIEAEANDNPASFEAGPNDITNRIRTTASVNWNDVSDWTIGQSYQTPDISSLVQELIDRSGWSQNNAMAFIITGTGHRTAEAYNGDAAAAPLLHIEYRTASQCIENWTCSNWSDWGVCTDNNQSRTRTCSDQNNCGVPNTTETETRSCNVPSCDNDDICEAGENNTNCPNDCPDVSDTTAPSIPANLQAVAVSMTQIDLSWSASSDDMAMTGYRIYRNGSSVATTAGLNYSDTGLSADTTYTYTLTAYDAVGNESDQSSAASSTTLPGSDDAGDDTGSDGTGDGDGSGDSGSGSGGCFIKTLF